MSFSITMKKIQIDVAQAFFLVKGTYIWVILGNLVQHNKDKILTEL